MYCQKIGRIFRNFVAFSEYLNFTQSGPDSLKVVRILFFILICMFSRFCSLFPLIFCDLPIYSSFHKAAKTFLKLNLQPYDFTRYFHFFRQLTSVAFLVRILLTFLKTSVVSYFSDLKSQNKTNRGMFQLFYLDCRKVRKI